MEQEKIVLCDTDVIIEFYRNNSDIVSELKAIGIQNIAVSIVTAGELIFGALNKKELNQIKKDLANLDILEIDRKTCDVFQDIMGKYVLSHKPCQPFQDETAPIAPLSPLHPFLPETNLSFP